MVVLDCQRECQYSGVRAVPIGHAVSHFCDEINESIRDVPGMLPLDGGELPSVIETVLKDK
jgi:hypothetical protein